MTAPAASSSGDARLVAIPVAFGVIADIGQNAEIVASDPERTLSNSLCCDAQRRLFNEVVSPSIGSDVQFNELERLPSRYNH
jgi:hypothetical protein